MLTKRIIPCLDVKEGRVVKGTNFVQLRDAGDPVELASIYDKEGADELVFLDITASYEKRRTMVEVVRECAKKVFIPLTVGGGIKTLEEMSDLLQAGADKISLNSAAVNRPELLKLGAEKFGRQCMVLAVDAKRNGKHSWQVYTHGGRKPTDLDCLQWIKQAVELGAGEILLTSMDADGTKDGYDIELYKAVCEAVSVPVIASGGAGKLEHFSEVLTKGNVDAVLAASVFHYGQFTIREVKKYLQDKQISVRLS